MLDSPTHPFWSSTSGGPSDYASFLGVRVAIQGTRRIQVFGGAHTTRAEILSLGCVGFCCR